MAYSKRYIVEKLETYKDLFDNAHDMVHLLEPDGTILYVNRAWENRLGYSVEEIEDKSIYSYLHEEDRQRFIDYRNEIVRTGGGNQTIVVRMLSKAADVVHVEGFVSSKTVDGKALYTRGIFRDVTARVLNEAALRSVNAQLIEKEANLQQLLRHAPDAVVVADTESRITYWNPKAELIFGWKASDVLGKALTEVIIPPQYRKAHNDGMKRYLATGQERVLNRTIEVTALSESKREFYVALTISPTIQNGKRAFIAFIRDIDEQKRNALELEQKKLLLEASNEQLEQFAHVASHDMKEPIRKILLLADLIQADAENKLSEKSRNHMSRIEKSAFRLAEMVDGVLTHSSVKREALVFQMVNVDEVVRHIEGDLELLIQQKEAVIQYSALPSIEGAPFLIYQLFYNLLLNSLKFVRPGVKPVIEITAASASREKVDAAGLDPELRYYEIIVKDNGIGFPQEQAETIFKSFSRLHSKDQFEGTGLGLSLCQTIVERHGGQIKAYGKEGVGASFQIVLPAFRHKRDG